MAFRLLREGRYDQFNRLRLHQTHAARASRLCRLNPACPESLFVALLRRGPNKTVKNATLILANLLLTGWQPHNPVEDRLVDALERSDLYRRQKMYVAEALLDHRSRQHVFRVSRVFLSQLEHLEDRPAQRQLRSQEMALTNPVDIYDVKRVKGIGRELREPLVACLCRRDLSGAGSLDLRRCLAFQQQRSHAAMPHPLRCLIEGLHVESDQMNAIHTAKFIRKHGLRRYPQLAPEALGALRAASKRWPGSVYLGCSFEWLARRRAASAEAQRERPSRSQPGTGCLLHLLH